MQGIKETLRRINYQGLNPYPDTSSGPKRKKTIMIRKKNTRQTSPSNTSILALKQN